MKLAIFHFCSVRAFEVLQFETKTPGRNTFIVVKILCYKSKFLK